MKQKIMYVALPGVLVLGSLSGAAPKDSSASPANSNRNTESATTSDHGDRVELGSINILNKNFSITRLGDLIPGKEAAFEVTSNSDLSGFSTYLWVESKEGKKLSAPAKGMPQQGKLHFHVLANADTTPYRIVLRLREGTMDEQASLPLSGHGHEHIDSPHLGVVAKLLTQSGEHVGYIELKLHDDKGDLELWIAKNEKMDSPFDIPLHSTIKAKFIDHDNKEVALHIRNNEKNEDEDGNNNSRNGKTNYFIYPSAVGQDAAWLRGKEFSSIVTVSLEIEGKLYTSEEFVLVPHTHADGQTH